jgi:hypothetical protein
MNGPEGNVFQLTLCLWTSHGNMPIIVFSLILRQWRKKKIGTSMLHANTMI